MAKFAKVVANFCKLAHTPLSLTKENFILTAIFVKLADIFGKLATPDDMAWTLILFSCKLPTLV